MSMTLMPCNGPMVTFAPDLLWGSTNGRASARSRAPGVWGHARGRGTAGIFREAGNNERGLGATFWETYRTHVHLLGPLSRPSCLDDKALQRTEGAGKAGCPPHPWSACNKKSTRQNHRYRRIIRPSLRNGFTAYT